MAWKQPTKFRWYDLESTGLDHSHHQFVQFAGIATDSNLELIPDDTLVMDIQMRKDVIPSPFAFAITGISPKRLSESSFTEWSAAEEISKWFQKTPRTCMIGFNNQSYDDEVLRNTFMRTFHDSYAHEWKNSNSRSDAFRLLQFMFALRPESIKFATDVDGRPSLKLGPTVEANGIKLENAHDALADVLATIDLARIMKDSNPKMWNYFLQLSDKANVSSMLNRREPLALVDRMIPRDFSHLTMIQPIIMDQSLSKMICFDLRHDPREILDLSAEELRRRIFTPSDELKEGEAIRCIRELAPNKAPMIVTPTILNGREDVVARANLDIKQCEENARILMESSSFPSLIREVYTREYSACQDVYNGLYSLGFMSQNAHAVRSSQRLLVQVPDTDLTVPAIVLSSPDNLSDKVVDDKIRMYELSLRAKWSNYSDLAYLHSNPGQEELAAWAMHMKSVWIDENDIKGRSSISKFRAEMNEVLSTVLLNDHQKSVLKELEEYVENRMDEAYDLVEKYLTTSEINADVRKSTKHNQELTV